MSKLKISPARASDIEDINAVLQKTWHATYDQVFGPDKVNEYCEFWHSIDKLTRRLQMKNSLMLVARINDQAIATACATHDTHDKLILNQMYVKPDQQSTGVGTALFQRLLQWKPDFSTIELEVEPSNKAAIAFYQKHGFEVTGSVDDCGATGDLIKALIMTRKRNT